MATQLQHDHFGPLLTEARTRTGLSRNALAHRVGVNPSYLTRIEDGKREPPRDHIIAALVEHLAWDSKPQREAFYVVGGCIPPALDRTGWDDTLSLVLEVLGNPHVGGTEREHFKQTVQHLAALTVAASRRPSPPPLGEYRGLRRVGEVLE